MSQVLLRTRKNEVFEIIVHADLDPGQFEWLDVASYHQEELTSRLVLRDDPRFYFHFDYLRGLDWAEFSPGGKKRVEQVYDGRWEGQKELCGQWAARLKQELEARDLWDEMDRYRESFSLQIHEGLADEPISAGEADDIRASIEALKAKLIEVYGLQDERLGFVSARLDLLADAARKQGKLTWVHTAIGVLVTIAWAISIEDLGYYWNLVRAAFRPFMHLIAGPG